MSRGRGPYFQLVRSYRQEGKVRQEAFVHPQRRHVTLGRGVREKALEPLSTNRRAGAQ
jgi:hypothetical protein